MTYLDEAWARVSPAVHAGFTSIGAVISGGTVPARDVALTVAVVIVFVLPLLGLLLKAGRGSS